MLDPLDNQNDFLMDDEVNENQLNFPRGMGFDLDNRNRVQQQQSNPEPISSGADFEDQMARFRYQNAIQSGSSEMPAQHANPQHTDFG